MQRGAQNRPAGVARGASANLAGDQDPEERSGKRFSRPGGSGSPWSRVGFLTLLFTGTILVIAVVLFLVFGKGTYTEQKFVNKDKDSLQAVFINVNGTNGGQVYFGHIAEMTQQFIRLNNVFYIQNQQNSNQQNNSAYNLVKLGCELHGPEDQMVINRSEVFFWENLKTDSQVAQKVAEFKKQNPDGQKCNTNNSSTGQQSTNTQSSDNTSNTTTNNANTTNNATTNTNKTTTGQ